jgi:hypothetical protein
VYLHAHRSALAPPSRLVYSTGKANHDYDAQLAQLVDILEARGGYLDWRPGLVSFTTPAELRRFVTLRLVAHNPPGAPVHQLYEVSPGR